MRADFLSMAIQQQLSGDSLDAFVSFLREVRDGETVSRCAVRLLNCPSDLRRIASHCGRSKNNTGPV
jgi:hypothetical protein